MYNFGKNFIPENVGKTYFPEDWIAPGEFRFCSRGEHLMLMPKDWICSDKGEKIVLNPNFGQCLICQNQTEVRKFTTSAKIIAWFCDFLGWKYSPLAYVPLNSNLQTLDARMKVVRLELARIRKDAGIPPLFWLSDSQNVPRPKI